MSRPLCPPLLALVAAGVTLGLAAGCTRQHYRESADRQVSAILEQKAPEVPEFAPEAFAIEPTPQSQETVHRLAGLAEPVAGPQQPAMSVRREAQPAEPVVLSLETALRIAALNSRDYQSEKEALYTRVLDLTYQRYLFNPQFFGTLGGEYQTVDSGQENTISGGSNFGFNWLLATGARLSVGLASSFSEFVSGDPEKAASSVLSATITQPLLQGAGVSVKSPLIQAEHEVVYRVREFVRYRRTFFVNVLSDYYGVLRERQLLENQLLNYQNLVIVRKRAEAFGEAGRYGKFEVDEVRQDELSAKDSAEAAEQRYRNALDRFKVTLGLPTETQVVLDMKELERLSPEQIVEVKLDADQSAEIALTNRLDLMTTRDRVQDAEREVEVAANDLLPGLDLEATVETDTERPTEPLDFQAGNTDLTVGVELNLPLDKLPERNEYRRKLIDLEQARRDFQEGRDQVVLGVRNVWRQYGRAKSSYEIEKGGLALAEGRVTNTQMLFEAGRLTDLRRVLDAQAALIRSQNAVTTALVDYKVASLELARDMDILAVSEDGQPKEDFDAYQ